MKYPEFKRIAKTRPFIFLIARIFGTKISEHIYQLGNTTYVMRDFKFAEKEQ